MTTSTLSASAKSFQLFSNLTDGRHFFSSNLFFNNEVVHVASSIVIENGSVIFCESLAGDEFRGGRDCEYEIRKAIVWLLNESAASLTLDNGYLVFVPKVFNLKY